jgi:hypothetical protein
MLTIIAPNRLMKDSMQRNVRIRIIKLVSNIVYRMESLMKEKDAICAKIYQSLHRTPGSRSLGVCLV